jgi:hypothetical protein
MRTAAGHQKRPFAEAAGLSSPCCRSGFLDAEAEKVLEDPLARHEANYTPLALQPYEERESTRRAPQYPLSSSAFAPEPPGTRGL